MIIDKVEPFITSDDRDKIEFYNKRISEAFDVATEAAKKHKEILETGDQELKKSSAEAVNHFFEIANGLVDDENDLWWNIEQRYIDSLAGNPKAAMLDVAEIINAITKDDFLKVDKILQGRKGKNPKQSQKSPHYRCRLFILQKIRVQLNALEEMKASSNRAIALATEKANLFFPGSRSQDQDDSELAQAMQESQTFYNVPNSPATNLIMEVMGAGAALADLPTRKKQVNHNTKVEVVESGRRRQVSISNEKSKITVELNDIEKLSGSNRPAKKLFVLALIKANEQAIHDGQLTRDHVTFPLQELIDLGFYKTPQSARRGFDAGMDVLSSMKLKGTLQQTKKKGSTVSQMEVLFTGANRKGGQCTIYFNDRVNWSFIAQYFTIIPKYYFRLPNRASDLLYYIFYLARQHTREIAEQGYFTIGFRSIQQRLQLPSEIGNTDPQRTIKQPIEDALEQIEQEHCRQYGSDCFHLLPVCNEKAAIADYLDTGYLKISLSGDFADSFIAISEGTTKQIEKALRRKDKLIDKAGSAAALPAASSKES